MNNKDKAIFSLNDATEKVANEGDSSREAMAHLRAALKSKDEEYAKLKEIIEPLKMLLDSTKANVINHETWTTKQESEIQRLIMELKNLKTGEDTNSKKIKELS